MRYAYDKSRTRVVSYNLQRTCLRSSCTEHCKEFCAWTFRSHRQFSFVENCIRFFHDASSARYENFMQQSWAKIVPCNRSFMKTRWPSVELSMILSQWSSGKGGNVDCSLLSFGHWYLQRIVRLQKVNYLNMMSYQRNCCRYFGSPGSSEN